jgi:hypothetical protein
MTIFEEGSIDNYGILRAKRAGKQHSRMRCPFVFINTVREFISADQPYCRDFCALFGEPRQIAYQGEPATILELCHKTLLFRSFKDKRKIAREEKMK